MATTGTSMGVRLLDALSALDSRTAVLHGEAEIAGGAIPSDIDTVVDAVPDQLIDRLLEQLETDGQSGGETDPSVILRWPYDRQSTTYFFADAGGNLGVQLDLVHDPDGAGRYGFKSGALLDRAEPGARWCRLHPDDEYLYVLRKRQVKRSEAEVARLLARIPNEVPELVNRAHQAFRPEAATALETMLTTSRYTDPGGAAFDRRIRNVAANPDYYLRRAREAVGWWVAMPDVTPAVADEAVKPLVPLLPRVTVAAAGGRGSVAKAKVARKRAGLYITAGTGADAGADAVIRGALDPADLRRQLVGAMADGVQARKNNGTPPMTISETPGSIELDQPQASDQSKQQPTGGSDRRGLAIFYEDAFDTGGAPIGLQHLMRALSPSEPVFVYGKATTAQPDIGNAVRREYPNPAKLPALLEEWLTNDRPVRLLVIGFFLPHNPIAVRVAHKLGVPVALHPMSQVSDVMFEDRVFTHGCDVTELEQQNVNAERMKDRVAAQVSPIAKKVFCATAGRFMTSRSTHLAALSTEEARQVKGLYPKSDLVYLPMPWGIDVASIPDEAPEHFYRQLDSANDADDPQGDGIANFVVWSRLDFHFKGLDRALAGARWAHEHRNGQPGFRLYLSGPDYRGGTIAAQSFIDQHGLGEVVKILGPAEYGAGSKAPLRDAEATVLLSRWDGSPRTLREAAHFGTPMLVTEETNFADLVRDHDAGIVVDGDDAEAVGRALLSLAETATNTRLGQGARNLAGACSWLAIGTSLCAPDALDLSGRPGRPGGSTGNSNNPDRGTAHDRG